MIFRRIFQFIPLIVLVTLGGCASLPDNSGKQTSSAFSSPEETTLGQAVAQAAQSHSAGQSGFHYVPNGYDAFVARAALAQVAEKTIDSQYYMVHEDLVGLSYMDQLLKAADRGVRVRFLIDDIDEGERDFKLALFDYHPNFEVRVFNPFGRNTAKYIQFLTGFGKQTRRAHNKSFTVDNVASVLGGRNIGDEYFEAKPDSGFADTDVLAIGPVAQEVSSSFDRYWNSPLSYPIALLSEQQPTAEDYQKARQRFARYMEKQSDSAYAQHLADSTLAKEIRSHSVDHIWADSKVYADPPEKLTMKTGDKSYQMFSKLWPHIESASSELIIVSPYFVPGKEGTKALVDLCQRGVRVLILTNSLSSTDVSVVHAGYSRYRKALLRGGVELYELNEQTPRTDRKALKQGKIGASRTSLHAKDFTVDRKLIFVGSMNFDPRSIVQNTEIGVVIESEEMAGTLAARFERKIDKVAFKVQLENNDAGDEHMTWTGLVDGERKTLTQEPYTSFWQRFVNGFFRLMPIESQI